MLETVDGKQQTAHGFAVTCEELNACDKVTFLSDAKLEEYMLGANVIGVSNSNHSDDDERFIEYEDIVNDDEVIAEHVQKYFDAKGYSREKMFHLGICADDGELTSNDVPFPDHVSDEVEDDRMRLTLEEVKMVIDQENEKQDYRDKIKLLLKSNEKSNHKLAYNWSKQFWLELYEGINSKDKDLVVKLVHGLDMKTHPKSFMLRCILGATLIDSCRE